MAGPWDWYAYQDVGRDRLTSYLLQNFQPGETIRSLLTPFRDLEYLHHQLFDMLSIVRATGQGLDAFGEMVKIARLGRDDDTYRRAILAKRFSSGGSGTEPEIKRAIKNIATYVDETGAEQPAETFIVNHYPAAWIAVVNKATRGIEDNFADLVGSMADAGVRGYETHDYGVGGFALSGVGGRLFNALGIAPTPVFGIDDQLLGLNETASEEPGPGDIIAPATGVAALTLDDDRGYSYQTATQQAHITLYTGQEWAGVVRRSDNEPVELSVKTAPDAAVTYLLVDGALTVVSAGTGTTSMVIETTDGDTLFVSITVAGSDVLGINESYGTIGGSVLAGMNSETVPERSYFYGTFTESKT